MKQGFVIHHNGPDTNLAGKPHSACESYWLGVKRYHVVTKGWSDIAYSFGVCHHGRRFVGRGWDKNQFANGSDEVGVDDGKDSEWYTVLVFLGWNANSDHPVDEEPSAEMVDGVRDLIAEGRDTQRCGTRVLPHNAFKQKHCPGTTFTSLAASWNHAPLDTGDDLMGAAEDILEEIKAVRAELRDRGITGSADLDDAAASARSVVERRVSATYSLVKQIADTDTLAAKIAAAIPAGSASKADIKAALQEVFADAADG